jgi:endonuclease/exonuclease/phosphatase family metal-dependent hydrolase
MDQGSVPSRVGLASESPGGAPVVSLVRVERQPPGNGTRAVRVLDWNLLHTRKDNQARLEVVRRLIESEQPDVVALQEASRSWVLGRENRAKTLADRLGFQWCYQATDGVPIAWEEGLAVLSKRAIIGTARRKLVGSLPRPLIGRQVLIAETRLADGTPFMVASVHLGFPDNGEVENLEQALDAADLVAREALARGIPAVLTGDLNARACALSVRALTTGEILGGEAPFVDAWAVAGSGPGITSTPANPYTDAPEDPPQRIDYLLVLQGTDPVPTPVVARVIGDRPTKDGVYGSDHFGLVVDLELGAHPTPAARPAERDAGARAADLCERIARVRSRIRKLRAEARLDVERERFQGLRKATLAKVHAAFGRQ